MSVRVFIVDDEAPARARLTTLLSDIAVECPHRLVGEAGDAQSAFNAIQEVKPDIVLLDVQMPGMTGIEFAGQLTTLLPRPPAVIFVTAYDEYALKAFEVHALDYLLKPVRASRLADAIRRACELRHPADEMSLPPAATSTRRQHFSIQERGKVLLVPLTDVLYLKAELKYVTVRTKEHEYLIEESLTSLEEEFKDAFVRVHRNALVSRHAIIGVERSVSTDAPTEGEKGQESWQVILRDVEERLPISRRQWPIVKAIVR